MPHVLLFWPHLLQLRYPCCSRMNHREQKSPPNWFITKWWRIMQMMWDPAASARYTSQLATSSSVGRTELSYHHINHPHKNWLLHFVFDFVYFCCFFVGIFVYVLHYACILCMLSSEPGRTVHARTFKFWNKFPTIILLRANIFFSYCI